MTSHASGGAPAVRPQGGQLRALLRDWRAHRNLSQLRLALEVNVSQRHLSFIESGRSHPSRDMVLRIADALDLPLRARNELLVAAGFAPAYPERPVDASDMRIVRTALDRILAHHEPYPAMVLDRSWNVVMRNSANARIVAHLVDETALANRSADGKLNFLRMMFAPDGMRPHVANWDVAALALLARVRREARANPASPSEALLAELTQLVPRTRVPLADDEHLSPAVPLEIAIRGGVLKIVNMLTTFGTPQDVGVQELRVEMAFPADDWSESSLREWAGRGHV
jgi:transcriptional regulator with XRE-family HTH domain